MLTVKGPCLRSDLGRPAPHGRGAVDLGSGGGRAASSSCLPMAVSAFGVLAVGLAQSVSFVKPHANTVRHRPAAAAAAAVGAAIILQIGSLRRPQARRDPAGGMDIAASCYNAAGSLSLAAVNLLRVPVTVPAECDTLGRAVVAVLVFSEQEAACCQGDIQRNASLNLIKQGCALLQAVLKDGGTDAIAALGRRGAVEVGMMEPGKVQKFQMQGTQGMLAAFQDSQPCRTAGLAVRDDRPQGGWRATSVLLGSVCCPSSQYTSTSPDLQGHTQCNCTRRRL